MKFAKSFRPLQKFVLLVSLVTIEAVEYELNNGRKIPAVGLGTVLGNNLQDVVKAAVDMGYRLIGTSTMDPYNNKIAIGKGLKAVFQENSTQRQDLFIASKLPSAMHRPSKVLPAIKKSLEDLQLEYLDLYMIQPFAVLPGGNNTEDTNVTLEETWRAMEELVKQGYTKSIGVSNFNSQQVDRILEIATIKPVVNEVECNPYMSQEKLREFCKQRGIFVVAYSPLYSVYRNNSHGLNLFKEPLIEQLALKYTKDRAQIVLRYLIQCGVIPIPKSDKLSHLRSNINTFDFTLAPEDFEKMMGLNRNQRVVEALWQECYAPT